jgi:hypothetical protein
MPAGKKGNAKAADQVIEETKVNAAKGGRPQSKSPAPISNKKGGKFESAPEPILQVRGRTKQALHDNPNPPATAEKGKARAGTAVSVASKKSGGATKQQPSKSPAAAKSTERSAKKPGKKASAAKHVEPENSSDDGEESKVQPPVQAKGKNKKPLSKCTKTHLVDMTAEKKPIAGKKGAMSMTEEKPKSRFGKIVEKPEGLQPTRPLTGYIFFSNEEVPKFVTSQGCSYKEAIKQAGAKWGELTAEQKAPYQKKYEQDKLR